MNKIKNLSELKLLGLYSDVMEELRRRGLIRTSNNPVADYAEYLVAKKLNLQLLTSSYKSADAVDKKTGTKYQIKSRRITQYNSSRQLGVIRNLDKADFNYLVAVFFDNKFNVLDIYKIPKRIIKKYARFSKHQNGHILIMRGPILEDKTVEIIDK